MHNARRWRTTLNTDGRLVKLERLEEPWARYDADFPNDDKFLRIPERNAMELRGKVYLVLLAAAGWSRVNKTDGAVPESVLRALCGRLWPATPAAEIIAALLNRSTHFVSRAGRDFTLRRQSKWQLTSELSAKRSEAGRKGNTIRWQKRRKGIASATPSGDAELDRKVLANLSQKEKEKEKEKERSGDVGVLALSLDTQDAMSPGGDVERVFDTWRQSAAKNGRTVLDPNRRRIIKRSLELYPLADVLDAVQGWQQLAHNRGENDRQRPYNDIELLLRDPKHIETFRDAQRGLVVGRPPKTAAELRDEARIREFHQHRAEEAAE